MKVRFDFVTNSSSSSFICLHVRRDLEEVILLENNTSREQIFNKAYQEGLDEVDLKGKNMTAAVGESGIEYIGWTLDEDDLSEKTLSQLRREMLDEIRDDYNIHLEEKDIRFDYGEIYR